MAVQNRNDEMVNLLSSDLQPRYEPNFAWKSAVSAFLDIPGLRGFWPMSSVGRVGAVSDATDITGQGRHLTNTGQVDFGFPTTKLPAHAEFDGGRDWLSRATESGLNITGTETYVSAAQRGLSMGMWFNTDNIPSSNSAGLIGKWLSTLANQRQYLAYINTANSVPTFTVSVDGTASVSVNSTVTLVADAWYFLVCRFDPSTRITISINGTHASLAAGIPASLFAGNRDFNIMGYNNGAAANLESGGVALAFLSCVLLSDSIVDALFNQTRAAFGV